MRLLAVSVIGLLLVCSGAFGPREASVRLPFGVVQGRLLEFSREFLSIPYAAKPERFAPPKPWTQNYPKNPLDVTRFGAMCMQAVESQKNRLGAAFPIPFLASGVKQSEDCLFLNIYTPRKNATMRGKGLPVMVWIHGGSLQTGTAMDDLYNGSSLAHKQGVVVVSINYRLNIFGFAPVQFPDGSASDNNGFRDQREALKWVKQNIRAFGGDPGSVTIFGESSGGMSVNVQSVSPGSAGLFQRTIMESGELTGQISLQEAFNATDVLAKAVGCSGHRDLRCLQEADLDKLLSASVAPNVVLGAHAIVGGDFMPLSMIELIKQGHVNAKELMMGTNMNEGVMFVYDVMFEPASAQQVRCSLEKTFGNESERFLELYSPTDGIDNRPLLSDVMSDVVFKCDVLKVAKTLAKEGVPVWMYNFKRHLSCTNSSFKGLPYFGAFHSQEIPYVFGFSSMSNCQPGTDDIILSEQIQGLWGGFAKHGSSALAGWPRYNGESQQVATLDVGSILAHDTEKGYRRGQCDALEQFGFGFNNAGVLLFTALSACQNATISHTFIV